MVKSSLISLFCSVPTCSGTDEDDLVPERYVVPAREQIFGTVPKIMKCFVRNRDIRVERFEGPTPHCVHAGTVCDRLVQT